MSVTPLLDRRLLFVTGKGGVGKTTVAAGLGLLAANHGKRTLVCEVDAKGNLADFFEAGPTGFDPTEVHDGLYAMSMNTEESLKEYLGLQLKIPVLARIGPLARTFDFVANAAPGVKEILTVGKLAWEVREDHYDLVVVDASASGHIVGQLAAPEAINELVKVGLVRDQTGWMLDILGDPTRTGCRDRRRARGDAGATRPSSWPAGSRPRPVVDLAAVVVNRVLPELFGRAEEALFERLRTDDAQDALAEFGGGPVGPILDAAELAVTLRRSRAVHLQRLRDELPEGLDLLYVPYLFHRSHGARATHRIAAHLGEELGY